MANENFVDTYLGVPYSSYRTLIKFNDSLTYVNTLLYSLNGDLTARDNLISTSQRVVNYIDSKSEVFNNIVDKYWKDMLWTTSSASYENYSIVSNNRDYKNKRILFRLNNNVYLDGVNTPTFDFDTNKRITFTSLVYAVPTLKTNTTATINSDTNFKSPINWQFSQNTALYNLNNNFSSYSENALNLNFKQNDWASYHIDLDDGVKLTVSCTAEDVVGGIAFGSSIVNTELTDGENELTTTLTDNVLSFSNIRNNEQIHRAKVTNFKATAYDLIRDVYPSRTDIVYAHPYDEFVLPDRHAMPLSGIDTSLTMPRLFQPGSRDWEINITCQPFYDGNTYSIVKTSSYRIVNNENRPLIEIRCLNSTFDFYFAGVNTDSNYIQFYTANNTDKIDIKIALDCNALKLYVKEKYDLQYKLVKIVQCYSIVGTALVDLREELQSQNNHLIFNGNSKSGLIKNVNVTIDKKSFADMTNVSLDYGITVNDWIIADYQIAAFTPDLSSHKIYTDYITSVEAPEETTGVLWYDWNSKSYKEYSNNNWVDVDYIPVAIRAVENGTAVISYSDWRSYKNNTVVSVNLSNVETAGTYRLYLEGYQQDGKVIFVTGQSEIELETAPQVSYIEFNHDLRVGNKTIFIKAEGFAEIDCSGLRVEPVSEVPDSNFNDIPAFSSSLDKIYQDANEQATIKFNNITNANTLSCLCQMTGDFDVCVDSMFGNSLGSFPAFKWNLSYSTQIKSICSCLSNYNCNSFLVPFSSVNNIRTLNLNIDTSATPTTNGRINNLSIYEATVRNGGFSKQAYWYETGSGYIDLTARAAKATGIYTLYQNYDVSTLQTNDELMLYANISTLQADQKVTVYLKDQISEHTVTLLDTSTYTLGVNDNNQYITKTVYDGDPIVANPLYLGTYKLNVTLDNLLQDDFILFDLTGTVWVRDNKIWVDTNEVYDSIYGSASYPTYVEQMNECYIGAFEDVSELPETTELGNFAYVFANIYVFGENGWTNVGTIVAQEDSYPRYIQTTNPHYRGNGIVRVLNLDNTTPDFTHVTTDQFMDLNLNDTEIVYTGTGAYDKRNWQDSGNRIGTTPHSVDSNYQLFVEFTGSGITSGQPVLLNSLSIQKSTAEPVYTTKTFKDIFSWNRNAFTNNCLTFTGSGNSPVELVNYTIKPSIEYTFGLNYTNSYASGRIRFKFVTADGSYTSTDWLTLGTINVGIGRIALGVVKLISPALPSKLVIEPDNQFVGNIDDLQVVVSNYIIMPQDVLSQTWYTISDSYVPVYNNSWIIKDNKLRTNGSLPAYSETNKQSAVVCYLDDTVYGNIVNVKIVVDSISGGLSIKSGDEQHSYSITNAGTYTFNLELGESASLMITTTGVGTEAVVSLFEVKLSTGTVVLNQDGYPAGSNYVTSATTFNVHDSTLYPIGSDIKAQQNRYVELFQNDSDSLTQGTFIKGFYNSRTKQIEAIEWRQDGYITDTTLLSYITSGQQTLNSTLLNQVFFDVNKTLYISVEKVINQENQPELKNNQVWYDTVNKKYYINISGVLRQVQYLGYCAADSNRIVICRARGNRRKLTNPIKPYLSDNAQNNTWNNTLNMMNQNTWKKFLSEQNSYWHRHLFADETETVIGDAANYSLVNVLTRTIPDNYNTTYENWMDAGEIYYIGQNDLTRNVYWDHELQCYRWRTNGDIVIAQMQKDANNNWFYHNLYSDYAIIDKSMILRRTAWKNENCTAQVYLIGGAGAFTVPQTSSASQSATTISGFNCSATSGGICVGGVASGTIGTLYDGLYTANSGKDMPLNSNIRMPNTGTEGWTSLTALGYGCSGTINKDLTITESAGCRPSGAVVYLEDTLRNFLGKTIQVAVGTASYESGIETSRGSDGAVIIIERWNS